MPFHALERPALGLSLLKAGLERQGIACDVRYLGFAFAEFIGEEEYRWVHGDLPYTAFGGDWLFTESLYGPRPEADAAWANEVLLGAYARPPADLARLRRLRAYCEPFLAHALEAVPWDRYGVVGFTSTFEQNIASLSLARRVRESHPATAIVFGGANWEGEMGEGLVEAFPFVDAACQGEADESFPALAERLLGGRDPSGIAGVVARQPDGRVDAAAPRMVRDLDALPVADFDDYVEQHAESPAGAGTAPMLLLETARGCWWGAKHHCTFCGLNGGTMAYRSKSPDRVIAELRRLRDRYGATGVSVVDNILDMAYFKTVLPRLADDDLEMSLFYEVKANLTLAQVALLDAAGVRQIQPGIESLADGILRLMRKGTTALQNVQLLKWCRELGVRADWNLLYGFPGEDPADYVRMTELVDVIDHLDPPSAYGPIRLDRFSPYHADPGGHGMTDVRPASTYRHLYPFDDGLLMRVAYYFEFEYADGRRPIEYARPLLERIERWMRDGPRGGLWALGRPDGSLALVDDRSGTRRALVLDGWAARAYRECDRVRTAAAAAAAVGADADADRVASFLDARVEDGTMLRDDDRYLALAVRAPARRRNAAPRAARAA